jgi:[acyl-carrier-protein] S-malonyltransferase
VSAGRPTLVFPGQGAQIVGMGKDLYDVHDAVRHTYDEASAVLGYDIAERSFDGPAETLSRTDITQPALLTNSIAILRVLQEHGLRFAAALGHSLGEYSALVATGALPFADALRLVARRGAAMLSAAEAAPGGMTAVLGSEDTAVEALCEQIGGVWPANYNAPGQIVVSGSRAALATFAERAPQSGARKVVPLPVSGAFHSPLVESAVEAMRGPLGEADWAAPAPPFFSVCSVAFESAGFADLLARQIVAPVRFTQSIRYLFGKGYDSFLEIGPGSVLSGLIRRIEPAAETACVADAATLAEAIERGLS